MSEHVPLPFGDGRLQPTARADLIVTPGHGRTLSKEQRAFNRLIRKVEKLRQQLDSRRRELEADLVFHAEHVAPRVTKVTSRRKALVRALRPFLSDRRLKAADRRVLRDLVAEHLGAIPIGPGADDHDLRAVFEEVHGEDYASVAESQMAAARGEMEALFSELGFDVDLSGIRPDMTHEELAAGLAELVDGIQQQAAADPGPAKAAWTKQELRAEARTRRLDDARRNSVGATYRRLVKALHPDLEPDPDVRERKSRLMQEVTSAHAANDLHALLRLEMACIQNEKHDLARLTDEKLHAYNQLLLEQARELEHALFELPDHPRYEPLMTMSGEPFDFGAPMDVRAEADRLDELVIGFEQALEALAGPDGPGYVRQIVRARNAHLRQLRTWDVGDSSRPRRRERPRRRRRSRNRR